MVDTTERQAEAVEARALRRVGMLARELVLVPSEDKELILAEMEFHRLVAQSCCCGGGGDRGRAPL